MNNMIRIVLVIARKKIKETLLSPAFYLLLTCGYLAGYIITSGFIDIIKSDGINPEQNPFFEILFSLLSGSLSGSFLDRLFAEGPFILALYISVIPFIIYLIFSSLFKLGYEKTTGALELVVYGPIAVHSYILGSFIRNLFFISAYLLSIILLFALGAIITNTVLGPVFFATIVMLFFLSFAFFSLCIFCSVIPRYSFASFAFFLVLSAFFLVLQMGTLVSVSGYVQNFWSVFAGAVQFISPLFYFNNGLTAIDYGDQLLYIFNILILIVISGILIVSSYFISRKKGVTI